MIPAIVWLLPMFTQFRKCAADNIIPSLTGLKKHELKLKLFVSIFWKFDQVNL